MIPFVVVVRDELADGATPRALADPDHAALSIDEDHGAWLQELRKQQIFRERTTQNRVITVRRIDAKYIHETTTWPTKWQPFIPWVHEETDYLGERDMRGTVRDAKDAQRVYNVNVSSVSEAVNCIAPGFLDSGLTVFASTPPRPARGGRVAPGPGFGSRTSPASTARCTSA